MQVEYPPPHIYYYPVIQVIPQLPPPLYYSPHYPPQVYTPSPYDYEFVAPLSPEEREQFLQKTSLTSPPSQHTRSPPYNRYTTPHTPQRSTNNINSNSPPSKNVHIPYLLIDTVEQCRTIVEKLLPYSKLAIDIEGISLSRTGRICIIQIATTTDVYLFDIEILKEKAFEEGKLRDLLESNNIDKLFYDARKDSESLYYQYNIKVTNIIDLQILYTKYRQIHHTNNDNNHKNNYYLPGLKLCFNDHQLFTKKESYKYSLIKEKGYELFSPQYGGNFHYWAIRPLHYDLIQYCVYDVMLLYTIYSKCCHLMDYETLLQLSEKRVNEIINAVNPFSEYDDIWRMINF